MKKYQRVYVEICNRCNGNCSFCPGTVRPERKMTLEEFTAIAQKLRGVTQYLYYHVMGEPLTHPLLPEMLRLSSSLGFRSVITTNGKLLPLLGQNLLDAGPYKVNVSIHSFENGTPEEHLRYLGGCMDFAEKACAAGTLVIFRLWNKGCDEERNRRVLELLHRRFPGEWAEDARGVRIRGRFCLEYGERFDWPDLEAEETQEGVFCYGLRDHFAILCDGSIVPCCLDRDGEITLGNIFTDPLEEVLNSPRAKAIVDGFSRRKPAEELCRRCGYARRF